MSSGVASVLPSSTTMISQPSHHCSSSALSRGSSTLRFSDSFRPGTTQLTSPRTGGRPSTERGGAGKSDSAAR